MKNKILWTTYLMIILLLPAMALAVTEGVVENAPQVEIEETAERGGWRVCFQDRVGLTC